MEILILWLLTSWVVAIVAESRGRIGWGWLVIAMVITPLFAILVLMAMSRRERPAEAGSTKVCPDCAETVKAEARIWRHCRHDFEAADEAEDSTVQTDPAPRRRLTIIPRKDVPDAP